MRRKKWIKNSSLIAFITLILEQLSPIYTLFKEKKRFFVNKSWPTIPKFSQENLTKLFIIFSFTGLYFLSVQSKTISKSSFIDFLFGVLCWVLVLYAMNAEMFSMKAGIWFHCIGLGIRLTENVQTVEGVWVSGP